MHSLSDPVSNEHKLESLKRLLKQLKAYPRSHKSLTSDGYQQCIAQFFEAYSNNTDRATHLLQKDIHQWLRLLANCADDWWALFGLENKIFMLGSLFTDHSANNPLYLAGKAGHPIALCQIASQVLLGSYGEEQAVLRFARRCVLALEKQVLAGNISPAINDELSNKISEVKCRHNKLFDPNTPLDEALKAQRAAMAVKGNFNFSHLSLPAVFYNMRSFTPQENTTEGLVLNPGWLVLRRKADRQVAEPDSSRASNKREPMVPTRLPRTTAQGTYSHFMIDLAAKGCMSLGAFIALYVYSQKQSGEGKESSQVTNLALAPIAAGLLGFGLWLKPNQEAHLAEPPSFEAKTAKI